MSSWALNPSTGDYLQEGGAPVPTEDLRNPAYYRITIPRLQWMYAPDTSYGSDLNTLQKKTGNAALGMISKALQPIIDDGRALAVEPSFVQTVPPSRNIAAINVSIVDAQGAVAVLTVPQIGI